MTIDQRMKKPGSASHNAVLQAIIDAMTDAVAVVAQDGTILCVNNSWRKFSRQNGGNQTDYYVDENYLRFCEVSEDEKTDRSESISAGLLSVLSEGKEFRTRYPCHSPTEQRWFEMVATRLELNGDKLALVIHRSVTAEKLSQIEASYAEQNAKNLAAIVTTMPDAVIAFDLEGCINSWNAAAEKLYGYEQAEAIGRSMEMLYPPNWPMRIKDYIKEIATSDLRYFDATRRTKSGEMKTIAITAAPIRSASGQVVGISNVHRDVTEERDAESRLRSILDNLFAFVAVLELDGTLVEVNQAPLAAAGIQAADVKGKKFWDCYWWSYSPDIQQQLKAACQKALGGELVRYDVQVQISGGQLLWIDFQLAPLYDEDGEIVNLIPSGMDISHRKAAEDALRTSHDTFENLVTRSPFGIYVVNADFKLELVSKGAQSVFSDVRPLIGHDFAETLRIIWPEPFATDVIELFQRTLETGEPYHAPSTVERRFESDELQSYDWMIERIKMPDGRYGVVCNFYDLTEWQQHEAQINLLMREVNHRSKNLLTVVVSMARQTARDCPPDEFVDRFTQRLIGLSASQDLIVSGTWQGVNVNNLIRSQLGHLGEETLCNRFSITGPDLDITPEAAQGIGLALHELSTNALKHGALSSPVGNVRIEWSLLDRDQSFQIQWIESGGPPVMLPKTTGFGHTVIKRMAAASVGGEVILDYHPAGMHWTLTAPIKEVAMGRDAEPDKSSGKK